MSFQKKRPIRDRLNPKPKSSRSIVNPPSTETRAEKLARKAHMRAQFHAAVSDNYERTEAIMAGTRWIRGRKVDRHNSLPHFGPKENARWAARFPETPE